MENKTGLHFEKLVDQLKFDPQGLVTAVALDFKTHEVLMLAHMNRESFRLTIQDGYMTYWSRSRKNLWKKGETSGNLQRVVEVFIDCDGDALLFHVEALGLGAACHEGYRSCFFRQATSESWKILGKPLTV